MREIRIGRVIASASEAIHQAAKKVWIAFVASLLAMTAPIANATLRLAARCARAVREPFAQGGRGECRVPVAPAVSCALCSGRTHTSNNEYTGIIRHSRTQWFYGLCRALLGDRALLPPSPADMFCLSPVGPTELRKLDASVGASGPHDFAVREKRLSSACCGSLTSLSTHPAIPSRAKRCRVHRTPPRVRDDRDTPLSVGWDAKSSRDDLG
jgi:hypothetical protein